MLRCGGISSTRAFWSGRAASTVAHERRCEAVRNCRSGEAEELRRAGVECRVRNDEQSLLWEKLAFLVRTVFTEQLVDQNRVRQQR
jgi:hypothetical protein